MAVKQAPTIGAPAPVDILNNQWNECTGKFADEEDLTDEELKYVLKQIIYFEVGCLV